MAHLLVLVSAALLPDVAFAQPASRGSSAEDNHSSFNSSFPHQLSAFSRQLAVITDDLPRSTELRMIEQGGSNQIVSCSLGAQVSCPYAKLYAGIDYTVKVIIPSIHTFSVTSPHIQIVDKSVDSDQAKQGQCQYSVGTKVLDNRFYMGTSRSPSVHRRRTAGMSASAVANELSVGEGVRFTMGGEYRICYSPDGTFKPDDADVVPVWLKVMGVEDKSADCTSETCLTHKRYDCYLRKLSYNTADGTYGTKTSCVVDFSGVDEGFWGAPGRGSWSSEFTISGHDERTGHVLGLQQTVCGTPPAEFICKNQGACDSGTRWDDITIMPSPPPAPPPAPPPSERRKGVYYVPTVSKELTGGIGTLAFKARSVAACYCPPDRAGCTSSSSFVQQIGILHFYLSKVCHVSDTECLQDYTGVTPQYRFRVRVECPTNACPADIGSRIKLVESSTANDEPNWLSSSGCGGAVHGLLDGRDRLPQTTYTPIDGSTGGMVNPHNCNGPLECLLPGGTRQDYKEFGGPFGFRFIMGSTVTEARNFLNSKDVDVCFCNEDCNIYKNWFKVGVIRLSPTRLVSAATMRSNLPEQWTIEFVNQPGTLGLYRPYEDDGALGLQEDGLLKIVADHNREIDDDGCALSGYNSQLTFGLSNQVAASLNYLGKRQTQAPADLQKLVFNSNAFINTITVNFGGAVAICYCAITVDTMCVDQANWKLVAQMTIKGPKLNQRWMFSTNIVFRFSYDGYGLSEHDTLRIISSDGQCTDNNFNPNTASFAYTGLKTSCPVPCNEVQLVGEANQGDLTTKVLGADNYNCDRSNSNCGENDINQIVVISDTQTELTFDNPHGLITGQEITLGRNFECDNLDKLNKRCTDEMVIALKSVTDFADKATKVAQAPASYMLGHFVTTTNDRRKVRISIGWPDPRPRFVIVRENPNLGIGDLGRGAKWILHSRGFTKEEVKGTRERANMRVCWRYGGPGAKYVMEVGRLTIRNPAPMDGATLSMTTTLRQTVAPMMLTFRTASGVTGLRYDNAQDSLRLKIVFNRIDLIDIYYVNGDPIPDDVPAEDEVEEASQAICGKLFIEMWSNDMSRGFPFPKGCYYKTFADKKYRELFMLFEAKSGLRKNTVYQFVFNGSVLEETPAGATQPQVDKGSEYLELYPMDDVTNRPYEAIESGFVRLTTVPQGIFNPTASDPKFRKPDGFKIIGGNRNLLKLDAGDSIRTELMGDPGSNKIVARQFIRIYLWPLTQWQTTSSCTAECEFGGEVSFRCGRIRKCEGLPTVPGMSLNILKITLPDDFDDLYGDKKIRIRIGGITPPSGGFFANRLAAQVTTRQDARPFYIVSSGDYIWKEPNQGQPLSRVVSTIGGGNAKPFRGDKDNTLYARLILSSTIFARDDSFNDASFTITLPQGYTCLDKTATADEGVNPWEVSETLPVFRGQIPQGRGTPKSPRPSFGWSVNGHTCTYTPFHPHGVVYAGSSLMIKIHADNPSVALPRTDAGNIWSVRMENKGLHPSIKQATSEYAFAASGDPYYQMNYAALGRITDAACQPTNFAPSTKRAVKQELRFFFRTEQTVSAGGTVRLTAPAGFAFESPCNASHLEPLYYAEESNPADATLRLPGIVSCTTSGELLNTASVKFLDMLPGGRLFGFKIVVTNPSAFNIEQTSGWEIFTLDAAGFLTDGTPETVKFYASDTGSWGIYRGAKIEGAVSIWNTMPFSMSGQTTYVRVELMKVPAGPSGKIRLLAPEGFIWFFSYAEYVSNTRENTPEPLKQYVPPGVNRPFPAGAPTGSSTQTVIWPGGNFLHDKVYGFAIPIKVPDISPKTTSNAFFLEMGYESDSAGGRVAAINLPAPAVRALQNAKVDYTTNIQAKENYLQFRIETVTKIDAGGGFEIAAPAGYKIANPCEILRVNDPAATAPPSFLCGIVNGQGDMAGRPMIRLRVGNDGLGPGLHYFSIIAENPLTPLFNYPTGTATPCATHICWRFRSAAIVSVTSTVSPQNQLDLETYAQGFSINSKMLEARIPVLTSVQRYDTGRDDRPMQPNSVIFAMSLTNDAAASGEMLLRGPYGFFFPESCLPGVVVKEELVFGRGNRFPPSYSVWPQGVEITGCYGKDADARLTVTIAQGSKLVAGKLYLFRIQLSQNPLTTPIPNRWTIEFSGQSSEPIEGMTLWAFTDTNIIAVTSARDRTLAGEVRTRNPLKITVRPFNNVPMEGKLAVQAPLGFQIVHLPSMECEAQFQELPYTNLGVSYPGYVWPSRGLVCLVQDGTQSGLAHIRLRDPRPVYAGLLYELVVFVYNPKTILQSGPSIWKVSSFLPNMNSLDESRISAFTLNPVMNQFYYTNPDPANPALEVLNGGTLLTRFTLQMRFPNTLESGDQIVIDVMASEYILTDSLGNCVGFRWIGTEAQMNDPNWLGPLPNSFYGCTPQQLTINIQEPAPIERDVLIEVGLNITNPLRTPNSASNYWRCKHFGPATSGKRPLRSSKAFSGWTIIPQLENVEISLLGPLTAAEQMSSIRVAFTAVTDADDVAITALEPPRFDFSQASVLASDQTLFLTAGALARVRTRIRKGDRIVIVFSNVRLGREGGQTDFRLTSFTGGMFQSGEWKEGDIRDEKLHYTTGFRLPGRVILRYQKLENDYHRDPNTYPVQELWEAQMSRPAYVEFDFELTQTAKVGTSLRLAGGPYEPTMREFYLEKVNTDVNAGQSGVASATPANQRINVEIVNLRKKELIAKLNEPLNAYVKYKVVLSVIAPSPQAKLDHGGPITWTIETSDGGPLPVNTNDGQSMTKLIVEQYKVEVLAPKAPPLANIAVTLIIDPGLSVPTEFKVVAPKNFNFTEANCLASGAPHVTQCKPGSEIADGRSTAVLTCDENGIREPTKNLRIFVTTPKNTPVNMAWFIEGIDVLKEVQLGWGEALGFEIKQMSDSSVTFPGIPTIRGQMVWRFRTQELVQAGGYLELELPPNLQPDCGPGQFNAISLPAAGGCQVAPAQGMQPQRVKVFLNSTIVPSEYAFYLYVTPPLAQPLRNELSIYLKDKHGNVRDAAVDLPGIPIREKLRIQGMPLVWTMSRAGRATEITMGFTVVDELPDNIVAPEQQVFTILLTLPVGFVHLVETRLDFQILNEEMPLVKPDDVDFMQKDRLRIFMNLNQTSWLTLKSGDYSFKFPALVPELLPVYNVWQLSLCRENKGPCDRSSAPAVLVNFAMPGFKIGQTYVAPVTGVKPIGVADRGARSCEVFTVLTSGALMVNLWLVMLR